MAVLVRLAASPDRVVSRQALFDSVWPGTIVGDHVLTRAIYALRRALTDSSTNSRTVQTVPKRGYRLLTPVRWVRQQSLDQREPRRPIVRPLPQGDAVAVLPLALPPTLETQQFLGAGISRDLTLLLSMIPGLRVIGSVSVEQLTAAGADLPSVAAQTGARYMVSGSIETRTDLFRLRAELVDTRTQEQLWAKRYDAPLSELFDVQDRIVQSMARSLASTLALGTVEHSERLEPFDLTVYEHVQLAENARCRYDREAADFIVHHLESALAVHRRDGVVHAMLAMQLAQNLVTGWASDPLATRSAAAWHLQEALTHSPNDSRVLMAAGISALMRGAHLEAMDYLERSLARNPNESHTLAELGMARYFVTQELVPSIEMLEEAERSAPNHPRFGIWAYRRGICYYEAGRSNDAIDAYDEAIARMPSYRHIHLTKAVALASIGQDAAAIDAIQQGAGMPPSVPYREYERGVLAFGLSIPAPLLSLIHI